MIDIVEDPDMIMNLREGDVVLAHGHLYQVKSINYKERIYFDRCDDEWLKERVSYYSSEPGPTREEDYAAHSRHIRFGINFGPAVGTRKKFRDAMVSGKLSFNR